MIRVEAVVGAEDDRGLVEVDLAQGLAQHQVMELVAPVDDVRVQLEVPLRNSVLARVVVLHEAVAEVVDSGTCPKP